LGAIVALTIANLPSLRKQENALPILGGNMPQLLVQFLLFRDKIRKKETILGDVLGSYKNSRGGREE
jgi:hypothetical protein